MKHYLITPWNTDNLDPEWLDERHILYEKYCLPSVLSQDNEDFEWLLIVDSRTPKQYKSRLESYPATIIYHDFGTTEWKFDLEGKGRGHRAVNLEYSVAEPLRNYIGTPDTDYVITSRLDSDDAISVDHIAKIQRHAKQRGHRKQRFWVNLVRGMKLNKGNVYPINRQSNPFISFVEPPYDLLTTYQVSHVEAVCTGHHIEQVREGSPTWLQVIHGGNLCNRLMRFRGERPFLTVSDCFKVKGPGS